VFDYTEFAFQISFLGLFYFLFVYMNIIHMKVITFIHIVGVLGIYCVLEFPICFGSSVVGI
jgi:hypothetical protein